MAELMTEELESATEAAELVDEELELDFELPPPQADKINAKLRGSAHEIALE